MGQNTRLGQLADLIRTHRWAALATIDSDGAPLASMVGYAPAQDLSCLYFHLSRLAAHTGNLFNNPHCALVISEHDTGKADPQQLARVSLQGIVDTIDGGTPEHTAAQTTYLRQLPDAEALFTFPDFVLFRFSPTQIRFVGGFGKAFSYTANNLLQAAKI